MSLTSLQRAVLQIVWRQGSDLYAVNTVKQLSKTIGERTDMTNVQSALQRLERMELIYRIGHGEYRIELPELELALEELADQSQPPEKGSRSKR
jgi:Fe2+ or Zn2+ uptake regulation protein